MFFLHLLKAESVKFCNLNINYFFLILILVLLTIFSVIDYQSFESDNISDWREEVQKEIKTNQSQISSASDEVIVEFHEQKVSQQRAYLQNNINPYERNQFSLIQNTLGLLTITTLFFVISASLVVSQEYNYNTIGTIMMSPSKAWEVILSKYLVIFITTISIYFSIFILLLITGGVIYGFDNWFAKSIYIKENEIHVQTMITYLIKYYSSNLISTFMVLSLAIFLTTLMKSSMLAVIGTMCLLIFSQNISISMSGYDWFKFTFIPYLDLQDSIHDLSEFSTGLVFCLFYIMLFLTLSTLFFSYKKLK
ncbi:ABC transporter permease [Salinicoccus carnicancri]|uniref:ABC transporter permease n=1 Tax=Salinicoccus carnicancri TaxID=558170 RepID=UPI0002EC794D|nr:ABC transporter permease [Salinicoccus carnicancri]